MVTVQKSVDDYHVALGDKVWVVGASESDSLTDLPVFVVENDQAGYFSWVTGEAHIVTGIYRDVGDADNDGHNDSFLLADGTKVPYEEDMNDTGEMVPGVLNKSSDDWREGSPYRAQRQSFTIGPDGQAVNWTGTEFSHLPDLDGHYEII